MEYHDDFWWTPEGGDQHPGFHPVYETILIDGCKAIEIDHKLPKVRGGRNVLDNYVLACRECNSAKRHIYTYEQFMAITEGFRR